MLNGIDIRTTPELLYCLVQVDHGDELAMVEANSPPVSTARICAHQKVLCYQGHDAPTAVDIIMKLITDAA